jgi:hypothetical protein
MLDQVRRLAMAETEVDPPHRRRRQESHREQDDRKAIEQFHAGDGAPGHQNGFTKADDDEERATLRHVLTGKPPNR